MLPQQFTFSSPYPRPASAACRKRPLWTTFVVIVLTLGLEVGLRVRENYLIAPLKGLNVTPQPTPRARNRLMRTLTAVVLAGLALGLAPAPFPPKRPRTALEAMQGTWVVVTCKADGFLAGSCSSSYGPCVVRGEPLIIAGRRATFQFNGRTIDDWTIRINATVTPSAIDMEGVKRRLSVLGICRLRGDVLTLCVSDRGMARPTSFDGDSNGHTLLVLKRKRR
jgi:uncharacterized protein (TIGR03067 family)